MSALRGQQRLEEKKEAEKKTEAEAMKAKIEDDKTVVQIQSKAGEDSRLFGSIPSKQIAQALDKQYQIKVDKRKIDLKQPIRSLGFTNVTVNLFPGIDARIRVHVIEQNKNSYSARRRDQMIASFLSIWSKLVGCGLSQSPVRTAVTIAFR